MCLRLGEPRRDGPRGPPPPRIFPEGGALRPEPGTPGSAPPSLRVACLSRPQFPQQEGGERRAAGFF